MFVYVDVFDYDEFVLRILWSIVKYLSTNFFISSFVEIPNLIVFLDYKNPWYGLNMWIGIMLLEKIIYFSQ